ncbi:MAG: hypothetical protein BMS9Abin31_0159 [Gammaproteobacteria bacterium]|nr:MAG: hypothetical protein BMS9Abin31_0159 [Gammaproteobacteria bacterium]
MAYLTQYSNSVPVIKYHIDQMIMTIGQDIEMDICVPEDGVANNHAAVEVIKQAESYRFIIKSREDESLLQLNGEMVSHAELQDGDWLMIGEVEFQFTDDGVNLIGEETLASADIINLEKTKSQQSTKESQESEALQLIKELKEELQEEAKPVSTKEFIANSHRGRPRLIF